MSDYRDNLVIKTIFNRGQVRGELTIFYEGVGRITLILTDEIIDELITDLKLVKGALKSGVVLEETKVGENIT